MPGLSHGRRTDPGRYSRAMTDAPTAAEAEQIRVAVADGVMTITLDRPERLNAWTPLMGERLIAALDTRGRR